MPCGVLPNEQAREASLAENIQRVDMDAMDEVDAYGQLVDEGASPEAVARRFGVTLRHVQQRLALAKLSPKIKAAWKRGDVTLDAARAFCLVDEAGALAAAGDPEGASWSPCRDRRPRREADGATGCAPSRCPRRRR